MHAFSLSVACAVTIVLTVNVAKADEPPDAERAAVLFEEGRRWMAAEDYADACPKLAESQALSPAADTAFDLGICYRKASQAAFKAAHDLAGPPEQAGPANYAPSLASAPVAEAQGGGQTQRIVGLTIGGVGVAGLIAGVITYAIAKSEEDGTTAGCSNSGFQFTGCTAAGISQLSSAHQLGAASAVTLVASGVALGTGAVVFFTAPRSRTSSGVVVGLGPSTEGAGLSLAGRF